MNVPTISSFFGITIANGIHRARFVCEALDVPADGLRLTPTPSATEFRQSLRADNRARQTPCRERSRALPATVGGEAACQRLNLNHPIVSDNAKVGFVVTVC